MHTLIQQLELGIPIAENSDEAIKSLFYEIAPHYPSESKDMQRIYRLMDKHRSNVGLEIMNDMVAEYMRRNGLQPATA